MLGTNAKLWEHIRSTKDRGNQVRHQGEEGRGHVLPRRGQRGLPRLQRGGRRLQRGDPGRVAARVRVRVPARVPPLRAHPRRVPRRPRLHREDPPGGREVRHLPYPPAAGLAAALRRGRGQAALHPAHPEAQRAGGAHQDQAKLPGPGGKVLGAAGLHAQDPAGGEEGARPLHAQEIRAERG